MFLDFHIAYVCGSVQLNELKGFAKFKANKAS